MSANTRPMASAISIMLGSSRGAADDGAARTCAPAPIPGYNAAAQARTDVDVNEVGAVTTYAAELGLV